MRIVSWNTCAKPVENHLVKLRPDIAVLPEWGSLPLTAPRDALSFAQFGEDGKRGLGVAAWRGWSVSEADVEPLPKGIIGAVDVAGPTTFKLIAVWPYLSKQLLTNPVMQALQLWADWVAEGPLVVAGDFNTGSAWTDCPAYKDHPPIVAQLGELGLRSAYHDFHGVKQGVDEATTFVSSRWKSHHMIDHIFAPTDWTITGFEIGGEDPWLGRSDHMPLIADLEPGAR